MTPRRTINWPRLALGGVDVVLINAGLLLAFWLRYEGKGYLEVAGRYYPQAFYGSLIVVAVFYAFGLYNRIWVHASTEALASVAGAVTSGSVVYGLYLWLLAPSRLPHTVWLLTWFLWMALIGSSRFGWRLVRELHLRPAPNGDSQGKTKRILIYGAGTAGAMLVQQLYRLHEHEYELVGLVDDDPFKRGMMVRRARVLGAGHELPELVKQHAIDETIIAIPSASGNDLRRIVRHCQEAKVAYRLLPPVLQPAASSVQLSNARRVDIADLLGRSPKEYPVETYGEYLRDEVVLVTGAGGSIGSEICRQVARFGPRRLILLGRGENRIHEIYRELRNSHPDLDIVPVIANVTDPDSVRSVFAEYSPAVVIHAAAHKHVYLMEPRPTEAVRNNVFGTATVADAALESGVKRFVMVSTDKAVAPISIMGASKRLCELVVQARQRSRRNRGTVFSTVRFGNVIGSAGSVLTIFEKQLRNHQPLTVTDPDATRFFMTIPEASLLVLQSGGLAQGGEIYVLDMGEPIRIRDLAAELMRLYGGDPNDPANYRYIGLTTGEKLHELLVGQDETPVHVTEHIMEVVPNGRPVSGEQLETTLGELRALVAMGDDSATRDAMFVACAAVHERKLAEAPGC